MMTVPENIKLPMRLDLAEVNALASKLRAIRPDAKIVFDAADVDHFGSLCAQTIIAGARRAKGAGGHYMIQNLNDRARTQLMSMGLSQSILTEGQQ